MRAVWVTDDDRLLTGRDHVSISAADGSWESLDTGSSENVTAMAEFGGDVYVGTFRDGVHKLYPGLAARSSAPFAVARLSEIDGGLIAVHKKATHVFDGKSWQPVDLPACEVGSGPS